MAICGDCISHQGAKKGVRQYACGKKIVITALSFHSMIKQIEIKKVTTKIPRQNTNTTLKAIS